MNEFELKFRLPAAARAGLEAALRRGPGARRQSLNAIYHDTADGRLAAAGLVVRLRKEGRAWVQTLKGPGRGFERLEHNVALGRTRPAQVDLGLHRVPGVGRQLAQVLRDGADALLVPVYETQVRRLTRVVETPEARVEIALDQGEIRAGERSVPVLEVEFELKEGSAAAAVELARAWCRAHGLWLDPATKSMVGQRLARGDGAAPPATAQPLPERKYKTAAELWADILQSALDQVLWNAREVALGSGDVEHIHQLRIGLRRLRTVLRELRDTGEGIAAEDEAALRELFRVLGRHRDLTLLVPEVERRLAAAGAPSRLRSEDAPDVASAVLQPAAQGALLAVVAVIARLRGRPGWRTLKQTRQEGSARLARLHHQVGRDGARFARLDEPARHRVRKRLKSLRYLAELLQPLYDAKAVDRFVDDLKDLQDVLGEYQDAVAARQLWGEGAAADPAAWFGVGWLAARGERLARQCESACRKAWRKGEPFW